MTNEQKNQIAELRQSGYGYANIAGALGLTKNQVSAYCRRNGLTGTKAAVGATDVPDSNCCRNCGKTLVQIAGRKPVKFCSSACRVSWWNAHPDAVGKKAFYDYTCACCGTHVAKTGEIGLVKFLTMIHYKGGVRISLLCGEEAVMDYEKKREELQKISVFLSAKAGKTADAVEKLKNELMQTQAKLSETSRKLMKSSLLSSVLK